jgi:hypothetical protein
MLKGGSKRPDILVLEPNVSPVAIEIEVMPAQRRGRSDISIGGDIQDDRSSYLVGSCGACTAEIANEERRGSSVCDNGSR